MATGRTIGAVLLSSVDKAVIELVQRISLALAESIPDRESARPFMAEYEKISFSRDAGTGRGAGKLQRDALCTRGRQGKAPFSNRNFRWHPLVVADKQILTAAPIDRIEIEGDKALVFYVGGAAYYAEEVHQLARRYVVLPEHWMPHVDLLRNWDDANWTAN